MKKKSWLIVANSSSARVYKVENRHALTELRLFDHPESRLRNLDLVSDKPGREFESTKVGRHGLESGNTTPQQREFALFAKRLADYLEASYNKNEFEELYLAAGPNLLGLIRQSLSSPLSKVIKAEINKDLTHLKEEEILNHFFPPV
jgi:protein required for attachment to host cells